MMLPLDDPRWRELKGGYRRPYDASSTLRRLERGEGEAWEELWRELHHQGDVGEASYAAVPHMVRIAGRMPTRDWNIYALVSTIEVERHRKTNPPLPPWLTESYRAAWRALLDLAIDDLRRIDDPLTIRSILGAVALAKGSLKLGPVISHCDDSEIDEILERYDAWSQRYD